MKVLEEVTAAATDSPAATALTASISTKQAQLDKLESRLNSIKDRLFADFRSEGTGGSCVLCGGNAVLCVGWIVFEGSNSILRVQIGTVCVGCWRSNTLL